MRIGVLGPLQVSSAERVAFVTATKDRLLLSELLVHANRLVLTEHLAAALWEDDLPANPANAVQVRISRLRSVLRQAVDDNQVERLVTTRPGGYLLDLTGVGVDLHDFMALITQARATADLGDRVRRLKAASELWRGPAFGELRGSVCVAGEALRSEELRLIMLEERYAAELALGHHHEVIPELVSMVGANPLRERPRVQLMLALHRSGRTAEALQVFHEARAMLGDSLGIDPGSEMRRVHDAILAEDPTLMLQPDTETAVGNGSVSQPHGDEGGREVIELGDQGNTGPGAELFQLPAAVATFTGREMELKRLEHVLPDDSAGGTRVVAVYGPGGTGKSTLAVQAAHRVIDAFPDGQLHVDLQGSAPGVEPVAPYEALSRFLIALGVPDADVPGELTAATRLYLSLTARCRLLVILDNAADAAQVEPLIPVGAGCAALITSRQPLPTLDGAVHIRLAGLACEDASTLLRRLIGARADAEPESVTAVARLCEGLPLALRIAGTRLATRPDWPVSALAARLANEQRRLDELHVGDLAVRSSIQLSCRELVRGDDAEALRALRVIAALPLRDVTSHTASRLLSLPRSAVESLLERLADAQLLESPAPDRYGMHDLTRLAVRDLAVSEPPADEDRLLGVLCAYYREVAVAGQHLLMRRPSGSGPRREAAMPFSDRHEAHDWFRAERVNILRVVRAAATQRDERVGEDALELAHAAFYPLKLDLRLHDLRTLSTAWHELAVALDNRAQAANALDAAAFVRFMSGRHGEAIENLRASLRLREELGDRRGQARSWGNLGLAHNDLGDFDGAARCIRRALALHRILGRPAGMGDNWNNLGEIRFAQRDYGRALYCYRVARECFERAGDVNGIAVSTTNMGEALLRLDDLTGAEPLLSAGERAHIEFGDSEGLAHVRIAMSEMLRRRGQPELALEIARRVLGTACREGWAAGEARARHAIGRAHRDLGAFEDAREELRQARALFRRSEVGGPPQTSVVTRADIVDIDTLLAEIDQHLRAAGRA